jgi:hypothetical protein
MTGRYLEERGGTSWSADDLPPISHHAPIGVSRTETPGEKQRLLRNLDREWAALRQPSISPLPVGLVFEKESPF